MKLIRTLTLALAITAVTTAYGAIDAKFYRQTAERVWSQPDTLFRADISIPDSIAAKASAVIMMRLDDISAEQQVQNTIYKASGRTNRTLRQHLRRTMVKLLDQKALDEYGEAEFGEKEDIKVHGLLLYKAKNTFGARIHKPDGTIVNIDVPDNAIEIAHGKKENEDRKYKIAIPGLAVGDILEYFYYDEELAEEFSLSHIDLKFYDRYPILNRVVTLKMSPFLTTEYRTYNGAPLLKVEQDKKENFIAQVHAYNIPAVDFSIFVMPARQLPFIRLQTLNNSTAQYHAPSARYPGFHPNILPGKYFREVGETLHDAVYESDLPGKAVKIVKNYIKTHPGLSQRQIVDLTWLAQQYVLTIDDEEGVSRYQELWNTLYMIDDVIKLKAFDADKVGAAVVSPRDDVPTEEPSAWTDFTYVAIVGDSIYYPTPRLCYTPGEDPAMYQGEKGYGFLGPRKDINIRTLPFPFDIGNLRHVGNRVISQAVIDIDPDMGTATADGTATYTGGCKELADKLTDINEWIAAVEDYLGIDKRYVDKEYDAVEREHKVRQEIATEREFVLGTRPDSVLSYTIDDRGILPGSKGLEVSSKCHLSNLATRLGDDLNLHAGKLIGDFKKITGAERTPLLDAMLPTARQFSRTLTIHVPDGYVVDQTSLSDFATNVTNLVGQYVVHADLNDDGDINIMTMWRIKYNTIPLAAWSQFLDLLDAAASSTEKSLLLTHK